MIENDILNKGYKIIRYDLYSMDIHDCLACMYCKRKDLAECCQKDDLSDLYRQIDDSRAIIIVSPIYMFGITGNAKIFLDRLYPYATYGHGSKLKGQKAFVVYAQGSADGDQYAQCQGQVRDVLITLGFDYSGQVVLGGNSPFEKGKVTEEQEAKLHSLFADLA